MNKLRQSLIAKAIMTAFFLPPASLQAAPVFDGYSMRKRITPLLAICLLIAIATLPILPFGLATAPAEMTDKEKAVLEAEAKEKAELQAQAEADATGTDHRDFSSKFMPYYRYTELENDVEVNEFVLFGMYAFNPVFAMTYEWPVAEETYEKSDSIYNCVGRSFAAIGLCIE